jgi:hypothetical protein
MGMKTAASLGLLTLILSLTASAQEPKDPPKEPATTGQKGELVPAPFRSYIVVDNRFPPKVAGSTNPDDRDPKDRTNKMHDLVCEHGLNPVVAVFVRKGAKEVQQGGVTRLASEMNKLISIPEFRGAKLASFVIFLNVEGPPKSVAVTNPDKSQTMVDLDAEYPDDEKRDEYAQDIRTLATETKAPNVVFGLGPVKSKAATAWGIADADEVTVVVFNRIRAVNRWKFGAAGPNDAELKEIIATVEQAVLGEKKQ